MGSRLLAVQGMLVVACTLIAGFLDGYWAAIAALFGGGIALTTSWMLVRRVNKAGELARSDPKHGTYTLYIGAAQRFVLVIAGLALGLSVFSLSPIPLLATFGVAQLAYFLAAGGQATG